MDCGLPIQVSQRDAFPEPDENFEETHNPNLLRAICSLSSDVAAKEQLETERNASSEETEAQPSETSGVTTRVNMHSEQRQDQFCRKYIYILESKTLTEAEKTCQQLLSSGWLATPSYQRRKTRTHRSSTDFCIQCDPTLGHKSVTS